MTEMSPNRSTTPRGFITYDEFTDSYGASITIRESSNAEGSHVWIFAEGGGVRKNDGSAHLTVAQAIRVRDALNAFIAEDGGGSEDGAWGPCIHGNCRDCAVSSCPCTSAEYHAGPHERK